MTTHSSILAQKIHGQQGLAGYSPWDHKESDMTEQGRLVPNYDTGLPTHPHL